MSFSCHILENRSGNGPQGPCRLWWVLRAALKEKQIWRSINHTESRTYPVRNEE